MCNENGSRVTAAVLPGERRGVWDSPKLRRSHGQDRGLVALLEGPVVAAAGVTSGSSASRRLLRSLQVLGRRLPGGDSGCFQARAARRCYQNCPSWRSRDPAANSWEFRVVLPLTAGARDRALRGVAAGRMFLDSSLSWLIAAAARGEVVSAGQQRSPSSPNCSQQNSLHQMGRVVAALLLPVSVCSRCGKINSSPRWVGAAGYKKLIPRGR